MAQFYVVDGQIDSQAWDDLVEKLGGKLETEAFHYDEMALGARSIAIRERAKAKAAAMRHAKSILFDGMSVTTREKWEAFVASARADEEAMDDEMAAERLRS